LNTLIVFRKIENCGECGLCLLLCNRNIFDFPRTGRLPFEPVVPTPTETKVHDPGTMEQRQILRHQKNSDSQFGIGPIRVECDPTFVKISLGAPTGNAAFDIGGSTLHSMFFLSVN